MSCNDVPPEDKQEGPTFLEWLSHGKLATIVAGLVFIVVIVVSAGGGH